MCEQTEIHYLDSEVVWVKLGSCWWPGEVVGSDKLPPDLLSSFRKPPIAVVKFFLEDKYNFVRNINSIYKYNCSRKNEFINKGLDLYRSKHGPMEKFPEDIIRAETATGGDPEILTRDEFQEVKKESYAGLFGDPASAKKGKSMKMRHTVSPPRKSSQIRYNKPDSDYKVHILVQGTKSSNRTEDLNSSASTSQTELPEESSLNKVGTPRTQPVSVPSTLPSNSGVYSCHACPFTTMRLNIMIHHNKTHSATYIPYTPSPIRKKVIKPSPKSTISTPSASKTPKPRRPRKDKPKVVSSQAQKRTAEVKTPDVDVKKMKTDEEIKNSLLADWEDMEDEESPEELSIVPTSTSPDHQMQSIPSELASVPTTVESTVPELSSDNPLNENKKSIENLPSATETPNTGDSKYEFCEDEDWPLEADVGRKIPRVKNPAKTKTDLQSSSTEENDVAREVSELLDKTTVPELPSIPDSLKAEENFPELPIAKSPDKTSEKQPDDQSFTNIQLDKNVPQVQQKKTIFKTKTFFRSRHSRSQDAIGKYVAEQLNAAERMDPSESEINGSESIPSPEMRESPPIDHVKVARLAPKIQLKKMKAEAQLREKSSIDFDTEDGILSLPVSQEIPEMVVSQVLHDECPHKESQNKLNDKIIVEAKKSTTDDFLNDENNYNQSNVSPKIDINVEIKAKPSNVDTKQSESSFAEKTSLETAHKDSDDNLCENKTDTNTHYMSETTASAVDALLSVSRETDRVTKNISNDLPEELFEDDQKDSSNGNEMNGVEDKDILSNDDTNSVSLKCATVGESTESEQKDLEKVIMSDQSQMNTVINEDMETETKSVTEINPSESDLQIAETLINLPSTALQGNPNEEVSVNIPPRLKTNETEFIKDFSMDVEPKDFGMAGNKELKDETHYQTIDEIVNNVASETIAISDSDKNGACEPQLQESLCEPDVTNAHFETEQEKSDNLNAAQSLVQMSETLDHNTLNKENDVNNTAEDTSLPVESDCDLVPKMNVENSGNSLTAEVVVDSTVTESILQHRGDNTPSKLLQILEEPCTPKIEKITMLSPQKHIFAQKEKILNFDVSKLPLTKASHSPKQKIIIRRANSNKSPMNCLNDTSQDKIILSRTTKPFQGGSSVPTYTIQASPDISSESNTIVIQPKPRKVQNLSKTQKAKPQTSLINTPPNKLSDKTEDALFDINSMPIVLSEDLTAEGLEKMPIVMTDGNVISSTQKQTKPKQAVVTEKKEQAGVKIPNKTDIKTLIMNTCTDSNRSSTPNIISKASKLKSGKPMIIIDKLTGKQRIIMPRQETTKEIKSNVSKSPTSLQHTTKSEKFIILPANNTPRSSRPQKIVIDPQSGKAHVLISKNEGSTAAVLGAAATPVPPIVESKPVSAKLMPALADAAAPGGTVMIITDAQGTQSRILLTSEHERLLFPNKQTITQIKAVPSRQTIASAAAIQKTQTVITSLPQSSITKNQTRLVPKQKGPIITSKGQLIVGGRVATKTTQSVISLPEIRPATSKRIVTSNPTKIIQTVQKTNKSEPLILLQQKSGTMMQLTAAQFEHLHRTGQIVQRTPPMQIQPVIQDNKIIVQKTVTMASNDSIVPVIQKQTKGRGRTAADSPTPVKKSKLQEIPSSSALTSLSANTTVVTSAGVSIYPDLDNIEELLPSTAIARQPDRAVAPQPHAPPTLTIAPAPALIPQVPSPHSLVPTPQPVAPPQLSDRQMLAVPGEHFGGPQGSYYLCVEDNGALTPINNSPLVLENDQLVPMIVEPVVAAPERRDILEAALANSDVFHAEPSRDDGPDFHDLNVNVSVHCRVSETSTTLNQPIMTPVEVPTKADSEPVVPADLDAGLAVIGVTPPTVPTSLDLPITVTDPRIAPKIVDPLGAGAYAAGLLPPATSDAGMGLAYAAVGEVARGSGVEATAAPISMPLLTEEEDGVGKSMPILTDDAGERALSSVGSTAGSPSSLETRDTEPEEGVWSQRLLTPSSDISDNSAEIPLQPALQLTVTDLSRNA